MQKTSFFVAALFDRSFRASPSSLKRDLNNSIQSSTSLSANGTVAQSSGSEHLWRTMSLTVSSTPRIREDWFLLCFCFFFNLLTCLYSRRQKYCLVAAAPDRVHQRSCVC